MGFIGDRWSIGDTLYFEAQTQGTSGPVDADSAPTYRVYEQGGTTPILTGTFSLRDASNTDGFYEASIALTTANGFEVGKAYYIRKFGTVAALTGARVDYFRVTNAGATAFVSLAGYPTLADVQARYDDMGLTAPADDTITSAINAAVAAWERITGYEPFLGTGVDETRYLTGEGCLIDFQGGLTDEPTSLTVNGNYTDAGVYENGTALVVNRDYTLLPHNAIARGKPYNHCRLHRYHTFVEWAGVKVVASFGYAETVPADVWEAIMQYVLSTLLTTAGITLSGGLSEWAEADVRERYGAEGPIPFGIDFYNTRYKTLVALYRRIVVA